MMPNRKVQAILHKVYFSHNVPIKITIHENVLKFDLVGQFVDVIYQNVAHIVAFYTLKNKLCKLC
jgi:hypothetical protein